MTHIYLKREKNPDNYKYRSGNTYFLFVNFYNAQLTSHDTTRNTCDVQVSTTRRRVKNRALS